MKSISPAIGTIVSALILCGAAVSAAPSVAALPQSSPKTTAPKSTAPSAPSAPRAVARKAAAPPTAISGTVFDDTNRNGQLDPAEMPRAGETVLLTNAAGDKVIRTMTTTADGAFHFDSLKAGDYRVTVKMPDGFARTNDNSRIVTIGTVAPPVLRFGIAAVAK